MLRESKREGREPDEEGEEADEEKGGAEKARLLHGGRIEGVKPASSQYTPMQGLEIVRIALAALLTLPSLGGFTAGVYFCASFAHVPGHVGCAEGQVVSGAGLLVLLVNLAPYCVILNAAQCLLSLNPDLINAESQEKRLRLEVQRLEEERAINCGGRRLPSLLQGLDEKRNDLLRAERLLKQQMEVPLFQRFDMRTQPYSCMGALSSLFACFRRAVGIAGHCVVGPPRFASAESPSSKCCIGPSQCWPRRSCFSCLVGSFMKMASPLKLSSHYLHHCRCTPSWSSRSGMYERFAPHANIIFANIRL